MEALTEIIPHWRYEDRTVRHVRVWPFDWDDDGLENTVDPDPLVAGPDAHGTNAVSALVSTVPILMSLLSRKI